MAIYKIKVDLKKIDKATLFNAQSGAVYLDATILMKDEDDQYGNCGMIVQDVSKADREAGIKGAILGNIKMQRPAATAAPVAKPTAPTFDDDLPF